MAGITPPATLSVVPVLKNESRTTSLASLDWHSSNFVDEEESAAQPSSNVLQVSRLAAMSMSVIPPPPPAANSSFHMQFFGPTLQCSIANSSQAPIFDYYAQSLAKTNTSSYLTATKKLYESGELQWGEGGPPAHSAPLMSVFSAFSPYSGALGWLRWGGAIDYSRDDYNDWLADLPNGTYDGQRLGEWDSTSPNLTTQQLWVQTTDSNMVCIMGNASFDVDFEFVDAALTVAEYSISMFEPFWMPISGEDIVDEVPVNWTSLPEDYWNPVKSYMGLYLAWSSILNGNVTTSLTDTDDGNNPGQTFFDGNVTIFDYSSGILEHGLSACDEIVHNYVSPTSLLTYVHLPLRESNCKSVLKIIPPTCLNPDRNVDSL